MRDELSTVDVSLNDQLLAYARDLRAALTRAQATSEELSRTHLETVAALAAAVDVRDEVTGGHVYRVANYGLILAQHVAPELASDPQLVYGFLLHDIGKLAVPDVVLLKAGPLDDDEQAIMRQHVDYGVKFIEEVGFLRPALQVVATHHESWDGNGYPRRLRGEEIPYVTRLFTVCDAFDAMIHDRPYRDGMSVDHALEELRSEAGGQFDPRVVAGFEEVIEKILDVAERPDVPTVTAPRGRTMKLSTQTVFDRIDEGLLLLDPDGAIRDVNTAFLELFGLARPPIGLTLAELVERTADRFADPDRARRDATALPRGLFRVPSEATFRLVAPEARVVRRIARTLYDEHGAAIGRLLEFRDVSDLGGPAADRLDDARRSLNDVVTAVDATPDEREAARAALRALDDTSDAP